jgi:hypothetical protein
MNRIDDRERRARLLIRHHLAPRSRTKSVVKASDDLIGLHASDPMTVYLAANARVRNLTTDDVDDSLYQTRSLFKFIGMRRTMFVVPIELAGIIDAACTRTIAIAERKRLHGMLAGAGISSDPERWLTKVEAQTLAALETKGEATASDLTKEVPGLRKQISFGEGKKWGGMVGVSTRVLFLLAIDGRIVRARPRGGITSSLYRWAPLERWIGHPLPALTPEDAQVELARRWLTTYGPGGIDDLKWWSGWTMRETRRALAALDTTEVELDDGRTGIVVADDLEPARGGAPSATLLPALDPTMMGWANRDFFLGPHRSALFDRNGNAGPTVWWDGRVVGGWAQRSDGNVVHRLLEDVGRKGTRAIEAAVADLQAWLGPVRFIPRFRTPLEQELSA